MGSIPDLFLSFLNVTRRMLRGEAAWTQQSYPEVNVKRGRQFEAAGYRETATLEDVLIITGDEPVALKALSIQIDGSGLQFQFYKDPINPTYTPATDEIPSYNLHKGSARLATTKLYNCTVADGNQGTPSSPVVTILGSANNIGQSRTPTQDVEGLERILEPNSIYLLERKITGPSVSQRSSFYATWYEGPLDYTPEI